MAKILIKSIPALWVFGILLTPLTNPWPSSILTLPIQRLDGSGSESHSSWEIQF